MFPRSKWPVVLALALSVYIFWSPVWSEVEICADGGEVYRITKENCPFGVLFRDPQTADCLVLAGEDEASVVADVCSKESYAQDKKTFQYIPEISEDILEPNSSCSFLMPSMCNASAPKLIDENSFLRVVTPEDLSFAEESNETNKDPVGQQTIRLFEFMMGLSRVELDTSLRVVNLLQKSFEIFKKFCPAPYVRPEFYEDVETAFLFMMQESDTTKIQDITIEEFDTIMRHLVFCEDQKNPLKFAGKRCATYSQIQRVNKSGILFSEFDRSNEDSFMKFDVGVEATWGAIDFVHGLCYGTFKDHINSHHLYQRALERLFTSEMLYRWKNRFVFHGQHIWNHFYSQNVKNALLNMDVCVQASYLSTPFLHRLERPVDEGGPGAKNGTRRRRKRWAETHSLMNVREVEGYCFQTKEEADAINNAICD